MFDDYHVYNLDASISFLPELTVDEYNRLNKSTMKCQIF